ncbi:hypothetical protein NEF87_001211 [Candidatus Lokiarchaeum ossiferum]|uniref:Protein kinase domain-containing protein n=1 Tax=Candidatus Lokiarchaeum ossiferum TaxID=2951803 RepID=A0ABY6HQT7_9ARCH|nr:hypothetical protein NEF87_001211 [Candidatus Lokiarchaeum sp. B-35]
MVTDEIKTEIKSIFDQFKVFGTFNRAIPFGNGHINSTFLIKTKEKTSPDYILQKINNHVFTNPPKLQENLVQITQYMEKMDGIINKSSPIVNLKVFPTHEGKYWFQDAHSEYWRIFNFIDNANSHDLVKNSTQALEAGKIIALFQKSLVNFPISKINDTIPNFHNLESRLAIYDRIVQANSSDRNKYAKEEILFVQEYRNKLIQIHTAAKSREIPFRLTHNDTKFNNILLNEKDQAISIIDLDTVMPGLVHYDFGDALRIIASTAKEDEKNVDLIQINSIFLESFIRGYIDNAKDFLTPKEISLLPDAPAMMAFMIGLRFLSDYLDGDCYFKTQFESHNLQRAKAQFALVVKFISYIPEMTQFIQNLL